MGEGAPHAGALHTGPGGAAGRRRRAGGPRRGRRRVRGVHRRRRAGGARRRGAGRRGCGGVPRGVPDRRLRTLRPRGFRQSGRPDRPVSSCRTGRPGGCSTGSRPASRSDARSARSAGDRPDGTGRSRCRRQDGVAASRGRTWPARVRGRPRNVAAFFDVFERIEGSRWRSGASTCARMRVRCVGRPTSGRGW